MRATGETAMRVATASLLVFVLAAPGLPSPALAIDGVVEVNQARADAGGITPGDTPGLPVTLSLPGSYRLGSDLVGGGIEIASGVDDVTIDLEGFTIDGTGAGGAGIGALGAGEGVTVGNGRVRDFAGSCVALGAESRVVDLQVEQCSKGIEVGAASIVARCAARDSTLEGIATLDWARVADNRSEGNGGDAIRLGSGSVASGNATRGNGGTGIEAVLKSELVLFENSSASDQHGVREPSRSVLRRNTVSAPTLKGIDAGIIAVIHGNAVESPGQAGVGPDSLDGIQCSGVCAVRRNTSNGSGYGSGIRAATGSAIVENVASGNSMAGIDCLTGFANQVCGIVGNTAVANGGAGLALSASGSLSGSYKSNTFNGNGSGDVSPAGLDPGFQNTCSGSVPCP